MDKQTIIKNAENLLGLTPSPAVAERVTHWWNTPETVEADKWEDDSFFETAFTFGLLFPQLEGRSVTLFYTNFGTLANFYGAFVSRMSCSFAEKRHPGEWSVTFERAPDGSLLSQTPKLVLPAAHFMNDDARVFGKRYDALIIGGMRFPDVPRGLWQRVKQDGHFHFVA